MEDGGAVTSVDKHFMQFNVLIIWLLCTDTTFLPASFLGISNYINHYKRVDKCIYFFVYAQLVSLFHLRSKSGRDFFFCVCHASSRNLDILCLLFSVI
jgi:phosphate starvation-inducible membrane PsiE